MTAEHDTDTGVTMRQWNELRIRDEVLMRGRVSLARELSYRRQYGDHAFDVLMLGIAAEVAAARGIN